MFVGVRESNTLTTFSDFDLNLYSDSVEKVEDSESTPLLTRRVAKSKDETPPKVWFFGLLAVLFLMAVIWTLLYSFPSVEPTINPSNSPSRFPSLWPSVSPSYKPTQRPSTDAPTVSPSIVPSNMPTIAKTNSPHRTLPAGRPSDAFRCCNSVVYQLGVEACCRNLDLDLEVQVYALKQQKCCPSGMIIWDKKENDCTKGPFILSELPNEGVCT